MFRFFEKFVTPYPDSPAPQLPEGFFAFLWACTRGTRTYIAGMTLFTAIIGVFEAMLFSMLGHVVDWLARVKPERLWVEQRGHLLLLGAILLGSTALVALNSLFKRQTLAGRKGVSS